MEPDRPAEELEEEEAAEEELLLKPRAAAGARIAKAEEAPVDATSLPRPDSDPRCAFLFRSSLTNSDLVSFSPNGFLPLVRPWKPHYACLAKFMLTP